MIRIVLSIFALSLLGCSGVNCDDFKTGRYKLIGEQTGDIVVERIGNKQLEISEEQGYINEFDLVWVDDCTYRLVFSKTNKPSSVNLSIEDTMTVEIVSVENNRCNTVARFKDYSFEVIQEKIN